MCGGVYSQHGEDILRQYFPNPKAKKKDGSIILLPWGRRQSQAGNLPMGGWDDLIQSMVVGGINTFQNR